MSSTQQTTTIPGAQSLGSEPAAVLTRRRRAGVLGRVEPQHIALVAVLALSAVLNVNRLAQNEYGNTFYSAAVRSMLDSAHNFFFISFDPGGLITVDKPPLALWIQGLSAELFGLHPLSLLLPEAIMGVLTVAAMYWVIAPRFGPAAGVASALALAVYPSFVAISRENGVDSVLILLMTLACGVGLRAIESGRLRTLLGCAVLVGLAFNAKTLAAYLVIPGLGLGYLVCAPGALPRRIWQLLAAGVVLLVVSVSWSAIVELTPASKRPFVGGSIDNTEHNLTFDYNGLGRVEGQVGGPGRIPILVKHGSLAHIEREALRAQRAGVPYTSLPAPKPAPTGVLHTNAPKPKPPSVYLPNGRAREPTSFGGTTGPLRLFKVELGGQAGWMLPFALLGMLAIALLSIGRGSATRAGRRSAAHDHPETPDPSETLGRPETPYRSRSLGRSEDSYEPGGRLDPRLATLIVLGGWFLIEVVVLSFGKGIVHPYYVSAIGPGAAAMVGAGAMAFVAPGRQRRLRLALAPIAVGATVAVQLTLLGYEPHYMRWLFPVMIAGAAIGVVALLLSAHLARPAMGLTLCLLLIAPAAYAATTWEFAVEGTFPAAGPRAAGSVGPLGVDPYALRVTKALIAYVTTHHPGTRWDVLTEASDTAAPAILLGYDSGAMGGYSGNDPALDGPSLARLVEQGKARYVVLGGAYAERGGNAATNAVIAACEVIPAVSWQPRPVNPNALLLYDCAGHERALRAS
ncbi:MAG: ArnT family glycosyltransferase [Solirubrobacteraceae bacterium]|jgi:4-amino-4-deoxy-L-arabinose transferase-like glycosyltransferase